MQAHCTRACLNVCQRGSPASGLVHLINLLDGRFSQIWACNDIVLAFARACSLARHPMQVCSTPWRYTNDTSFLRIYMHVRKHMRVCTLCVFMYVPKACHIRMYAHLRRRLPTLVGTPPTRHCPRSAKPWTPCATCPWICSASHSRCVVHGSASHSRCVQPATAGAWRSSSCVEAKSRRQ